MNKELINKIRASYCPNENMFRDDEIVDNVIFDCNNLLDLQLKLEYEIDCDEIYEEDIQTLEHILDYMELFISLLKEKN